MFRSGAKIAGSADGRMDCGETGSGMIEENRKRSKRMKMEKLAHANSSRLPSGRCSRDTCLQSRDFIDRPTALETKITLGIVPTACNRITPISVIMHRINPVFIFPVGPYSVSHETVRRRGKIISEQSGDSHETGESTQPTGHIRIKWIEKAWKIMSS